VEETSLLFVIGILQVAFQIYKIIIIIIIITIIT